MAKIADTVTGARVLGSRVLQAHRAANPKGQMPLMEHIRELRNRVLKAVLALLAGTGIGLIPVVFNPTWHFMERPFCQAVIRGKTGCHVLGDQLVINGVLDPFMFRVKIAFFFGLVISSPVWLYQIWAFIAPGLYQRERRWTYAFLFTAVPLFLAGTGLAYLVMSALVMLNMAGILSHERIKKWRRVMIFSVFVFAGIASPSPDPVTMLLLAVPCVVLVEVSELIIWANDRRRANRPTEYGALADDELSPLDDDTVGSDPPDQRE